MARQTSAKYQRNSLSADEAEALFSKLDETGHENDERAESERRSREERGVSVTVDPLSEADPSGDDTDARITRTATTVCLVILVAVVLAQLAYGFVRRFNTASLSDEATVQTVASALSGGVEWGDGFTSFPSEFSVQEADENTGRVEVTVTDTDSTSVLECFSSSQIQATAFSVNALLNPNINTVVYNVNVHVDENGDFLTTTLFGFLRPTGNVARFMTFTWTKTQTADGGVYFNCTISGVDANTQELLHDQLTTGLTPVSLLTGN